MYLCINPYLEPSNFINDCRSIAGKIIKFRVGSHYLPIETGRWCRKAREDRLCANCNVLGNEIHLIFNCRLIDRTGLQLPNSFTELWKCDDVFELFKRIDRCSEFIK